MSILGFIIGILTGIGATVSLLPLLGWLNWLNIPVAIIGLVFSILGVNKGRNKGIGTAGIIINAILIVYGIIRLIIGGGFI
ncbi:MAG: hypothetical protein WCZ22_05750 [Dehalococcoidales bacterium]|jgi:hypothetical protein|nr:hypothetical protein [Dehalococcoidales bacterium]NLT27868.1 hypothetical protein [Dehalococcoidales bacterium]